MVAGSPSGAALLLDVDGVLIPYGPPSDEWGEWIRHHRREDLVVSRQMVAAIDALGADVYWLTSWSHTANSLLCPFIDWPPKKVLEKRTVKHWWKLGAAHELLTSSPYGRVAWVDDDLDQYRDEVDSKLGHLLDAGRLLLVCTESSIGLTRRHIESIRDFLAS